LRLDLSRKAVQKSGIHEREFDVRIEEALAAAGDENFVPACSKGFDQAQDVSFAPAAIAR